MEYPKEDKESSRDLDRPTAGTRKRQSKTKDERIIETAEECKEDQRREAAAAAALTRAEEQEARKREARAKDQRAIEAAKRAEEEKIEARNRAAAEASGAIERRVAIKLAQAKEAAKLAAEIREAEAAIKAPEEALEIKRREAAAAQEVLERQDVMKSLQAKEVAAKGMADALENSLQLYEKYGRDISIPSHNIKEDDNTNTSNRSIQEKSGVKNTDRDKHRETSMYDNRDDKKEREARARAQKFRDARKEEDKKIEARKTVVAAEGEVLERQEERKSADAREAARLAAERRYMNALNNPKNYEKDAVLSSLQHIIPDKKGVHVTQEQYMKESKQDNYNLEKCGIADIHGSTKPAVSSLASTSIKTAAGQEQYSKDSNQDYCNLREYEKADTHECAKQSSLNLTPIASLEREIVNVMGSSEENIHVDYMRATMDSNSKEESCAYPAHQGSKKNKSYEYVKDYSTELGGTGSKERTVKYPEHNRYHQVAQNDALQDAATNTEQKQRTKCSSEKEIVSVNGNQMNKYEMEKRRGAATNEDEVNEHEKKRLLNKDQMSEYEEPGRPTKMNGRYTNTYIEESSRQELSGGFEDEYYTEDSGAVNLSESYHCQGTHNQRNPYHHGPPTKRNSGFGSSQQHHHSEYHPQHHHSTYNHQQHHHKGKKQEVHYKDHHQHHEQMHQRIPNFRSSTSNDRKEFRPKHENYSTGRSGSTQPMNILDRMGKMVWKSSVKKSPHGSKCLDMGVRPSSYCSTCEVWVCTECAKVEHKYGNCNLRPLKNQLTDMKKQHDNVGNATRELLGKTIESLENGRDQERALRLWMRMAFECMEKNEGNIDKAMQDGREMMNTLSDVMQLMSNSQNLPEALTSFQILEDVACEVQQWFSSDGVNAIDADNGMTACLKFLVKRTLKSVKMRDGTCELCASDRTPGGERFSELMFEGGRFHLHALAKDKPTKLGARALPLECFKLSQDATSTLVFLDLSWKGQCRGRLYIRLTGDTIRGRQFISLCTGEGGISFRGTRFHRVWGKGLPGEHIWTGDYENSDGSGGRPRPLSGMPLQVPAGREVTISAGLVAGCYGKKNPSSIFRIYTKEEKEAKDEAVFGQVEFGLDIVKEAVKLNNISEVKISDCGLVVEV